MFKPDVEPLIERCRAGDEEAISELVKGFQPAVFRLALSILDDPAEVYKDVQPWQRHGSIYHLFPAKPGHLKPTGEWNSEEIHVKGTQWTVTVNGMVIVDADISKVEGLEKPAQTTKAPLGFLGHGTRVEFRNLRIKELK